MKAASVLVLALLLVIGAGACTRQDVPDRRAVGNSSDPDLVTSSDPRPVATLPDPLAAQECGEGWTRFVNTALHYWKCLPDSWGLVDLARKQAITVSEADLYYLRIASGELFPWVPHTSQADMLDANRDGMMMTVSFLYPDSRVDPACAKSVEEEFKALSPRRACTYRFNLRSGEYDFKDDGEFITTQLVLDLLHDPEPRNKDEKLEGSRLMAYVTTSVEAYRDNKETIHRVLASIVPYELVPI